MQISHISRDSSLQVIFVLKLFQCYPLTSQKLVISFTFRSHQTFLSYLFTCTCVVFAVQSCVLSDAQVTQVLQERTQVPRQRVLIGQSRPFFNMLVDSFLLCTKTISIAFKNNINFAWIMTFVLSMHIRILMDLSGFAFANLCTCTYY